MNILLIEPDTLLGKVYVKALEQAGHTVAWVKGAQQAIALADMTTPDAVVSELQLPGHGGIEFLYEFRSYPEWQAIPVILHTLVMTREMVFPDELGVVEQLYKPATSLKQLVRAVDEIVTTAK